MNCPAGQKPWFTMSLTNQLAYAHALNQLQNGSVICMGPFYERNFATLSDVGRIFTVE